MNQIPLVDLKQQYRRYQGEFEAALRNCLERTSFIGGPDHKEFEKEFAEYCGGGAAALCGNGTDAITLALLAALGKGDGREAVITVSHTFIATAEAITNAGYQPIFVDIDPDTYHLDLKELKRFFAENCALKPSGSGYVTEIVSASPLTPHLQPGTRVRGILPVHIYGQMAAMDEVMEISREYHLAVIEDAAQAHGALWQDKGPGQWGTAACFSFYPGKNLGAWGDGGAVFSRDRDLIEKIKMWANHGRKSKYLHEFEGINSRLDGLQAAVLRVKLRHLDDGNAERRQLAAHYNNLLQDLPGIKLPVSREGAKHVYHLYVIQVPERDRIKKELENNGVAAGIHYPVPLHEQPAFQRLGMKAEALPVTHRAAANILSLPMYPELSPEQVRTVVEILKKSL